ncbi:MAG TPA: T9SS type A sorting domain-containing protein, partial [Chitinophagaceae bacterium]|nr:T9SS type A sorting domain-containing protein [Chitinophagaceae bacterium]
CEWRGDLYAATLGSSVFKLDPVRRDNWLAFSNGLSSLSANINTIAANNNALVAGTNANGLYDYLPANATTWDERFLLGQIHATEGIYDIITAHDSLFLSGHTGKFYMSVDNGLNWNTFGISLVSHNTSLANAKQALLLSRSVFDGFSFTTFFDYIKKDALQGSFIRFSSLPNHFSYKLDIVGDRIWNASSNGLFYMSLSDLPGITSADDTITATPLPVRFISFNAKCEGNKLEISWKTAQEQNCSHFNIEESPDGINWTVIATQTPAGNSAIENSYSFTKDNPTQNNFYRIAEYDLDGRVNYTGTIKSSCNTPDVFRLWPNPTRDKVVINLISDHESQAIIKIFDSKGSLVKEQRTNVLQGNNQFAVDLTSMARGVYQLQINWNNGQNRNTTRIIKM